MASVTFSGADGALFAYLVGEIDHHAAQALREAIDIRLDRAAPERLTLDFGGVTFMDSSGVGLILGRQKRMQALGGSLIVQRPPAQIQKMLQLARVSYL